MSKQNIKPIELKCKKIKKGDVYALIESVATETEESINNAISEINRAIPEQRQPYNDAALDKRVKIVESKEQIIYDDSKVKLSIKKLESIKPYDETSLVNRIKAVESQEQIIYDDSSLRDKIKKIDEKTHPEFNDEAILGDIKKLFEITASQAKEIEELKKAVISTQRETRSNRKEAGFKIDTIEQKLNKLTEIK